MFQHYALSSCALARALLNVGLFLLSPEDLLLILLILLSRFLPFILLVLFTLMYTINLDVMNIPSPLLRSMRS